MGGDAPRQFYLCTGDHGFVRVLRLAAHAAQQQIAALEGVARDQADVHCHLTIVSVWDE